MLDTYSSPTTSTTQATAQNTTSAPVADPHQAAQERLAALLEELKADQLKPAAPKIEEVASLPLDNLAVQRPKSGLAQSQPTVEEQIDLIVPNPAGAYGQLMQKLNQNIAKASHHCQI